MNGEPIDLSAYRTIASGTAQGQAELRQIQAAAIIAPYIVQIVATLFDAGLLAAGESMTFPVRTPTQTIVFTIAAGEHETGEQS